LDILKLHCLGLLIQQFFQPDFHVSRQFLPPVYGAPSYGMGIWQPRLNAADPWWLETVFVHARSCNTLICLSQKNGQNGFLSLIPQLKPWIFPAVSS
jgi:hypothetical protein